MKAIPVVEVFGPTVQGEGPDAGRTCYFVRFGGCDYSCSWCDSLHAVLPAEVRKAERIDQSTIFDRLAALGCGPGDTVVLSGGNPALHDLELLVSMFHRAGIRSTVETQGSRWKDWMGDVDLVVVSPKPPSSGMVTDWTALETVMSNLRRPRPDGSPAVALKVVVGDDIDYDYAVEIRARFPREPFHLSVLNPAGSDEAAFDVLAILAGYRDLCERVKVDKRMQDAVVLPQLHTLAWGAAQGV